ncbi:hypothetical protein N0V94_004274 [Neodidymelliopsis sp. IMI 364377]|nr:hypothetical protein N0V94_004274 [Neodidymelliopsis sp. IMI 364377]
MKDARFFFSPKGNWNSCHGDGKATTRGAFIAQTQPTTGEPTAYRVHVLNVKAKYVAISSITLEAQPGNKPPLDADVVNVLREAVGLGRK